LAQDPAAFFSALADPTRLRLIRMLGQEPGGGGLCVNVLALRLGISQPAVSQHLGRLRDLGWCAHGGRACGCIIGSIGIAWTNGGRW
jgi:DNA-binding transcriptional ArsR family regulator